MSGINEFAMTPRTREKLLDAISPLTFDERVKLLDAMADLAVEQQMYVERSVVDKFRREWSDVLMTVLSTGTRRK